MPTALGTFSDDPQARWLLEERLLHDPLTRDMYFLRELCFEDPHGTVWRTPEGSVVNGTSIQQRSGRQWIPPTQVPYRWALIVHNVATIPNPTAAYAATDHMVYQACLVGDGSLAQAELRFGKTTHWGLAKPSSPCISCLAGDPTGHGPPSAVCNRQRVCAYSTAKLLRECRRHAPFFPQLQALAKRHLQAREAQVLPVLLPMNSRQLLARPVH